MSAKVDVLAWFDDYIRRCGIYDDGTPIRSAVAELIDAADEALVLLEQLDPEHGITTHLRAALANIGPQS